MCQEFAIPAANSTPQKKRSASLKTLLPHSGPFANLELRGYFFCSHRSLNFVDITLRTAAGDVLLGRVDGIAGARSVIYEHRTRAEQEYHDDSSYDGHHHRAVSAGPFICPPSASGRRSRNGKRVQQTDLTGVLQQSVESSLGSDSKTAKAELGWKRPTRHAGCGLHFRSSR